MSFLDLIFNKREKSISESSKKLYTRNLQKLNDNKEIDSFDFLTSPKFVLAKINHLSPNTQKSYIIAICTVLKNSDEAPLYDAYYSLLKQANSKLSVNVTKSKAQAENWITKDQVTEIQSGLKKEVNFNKKSTTKAEYDKLLHYLLISLYTMAPPRRNIDYTLMRVSNKTDSTDFNYIDLPNRQFIFNRYKTAGTYKSVSIYIPDDLMKVVMLYLRSHPHVHKLKNITFNISFIISSDGTEFSSDKMTKTLQKIFGKKVSSSMLRNIYLTDKYSDVVSDLKHDAAEMGTSMSTALNNYIKQD